MSSKYSIRRSKPLPPLQARAEARAKLVLAITQAHQALAQELKMAPVAIAKIERHTDIYIATLREQVEAMGGQLQVLVRFAEGAVKLHNFIDLDNDAHPEPSLNINVPSAGGEKTPITTFLP